MDLAGYIDVEESYARGPATQLDGISEGQILGVEAPLWTETIRIWDQAEYLIFSRLISIAEIGWSKAADRDWNEYRVRLGEQGPRLAAWKVNYYRSPQVAWK